MSMLLFSDARIAIIGAGMAGLACATSLVAAGHRQISLFDKGRAPGGRIATRRVFGASFDHGAQYITARSDEMQALMEKLAAEECVAAWPQAQHSNDLPWTGTPGMSAIPGAMAGHLQQQGVIFHNERHVAWLHSDNRVRHLPSSEAKLGSAQDHGGALSEPFDVILLALPAPQAIPLLASMGHHFATQLAPVVIAPCWAVMMRFEPPLPGPDIIRPERGPLAWIARNSSKPGHGHGGDAWVLHASAAWSRAHLEDSAKAVEINLLRSFTEITQTPQTPCDITAHRWRYAQVETPLGQPYLWDADAGLGLCGDWCLGPRVEAAYDSGSALAHAVLAQQKALA